jgi:hypothetical protein
VIDACNPIGGGPPVNGVLSFFPPQNESLMERLQKAYPAAHFVKAFNSVGNGQMVNPEFAGGRPTMFICGNDGNAKGVVRQILDQFGWDAEDMGAVEAARAIESLCKLWCIPGIGKGDWSPQRSSCCGDRARPCRRNLRSSPPRRSPRAASMRSRPACTAWREIARQGRAGRRE